MPIMILIVEILLIVNRYKMENLKTNWKLPKKQKIPAANRKLAARKLKTFWKQQDLFCFFSKKLPSPLPQFRILREDEAIKMSNSLKTAGHLYKTQLENWLSKPPIFNDTAKKKACDIFLSQAFGGSWWIRTTEALSSRFTVCPHWPLGKAPLFDF